MSVGKLHHYQVSLQISQIFVALSCSPGKRVSIHLEMWRISLLSGEKQANASLWL